MAYNIGPTLSVGGEKEYSAAMARVRESMTYVKAEANAAISVYSKNEKSVESLTAQINASKQAYDVQKQAVQAAEDALARMKANGVDESSTAYKRMEANLNNAKTAMNQTGTEVKELERDLKSGGDQTKTFGAKIKEFAASSVGQMMSLAGAVALAKQALQALWNIIDGAADAADELLTLSAQTGLAVDTLQEMQYAARFVDVELDTMTNGLARTVKAIREASGAGKDYLEISDGVLVSTRDQNGILRDSEEVFYDVIDAIGGLANETERETAAQVIFGKSYQDIMPLIRAGSGAVKEYGAEARETGKTIDTITVKALGRLDDTLEEVAATAEATSRRTAAAMVRVTDWAARAWEDILQAIDPVNLGMERFIGTTTYLTGATREQVEAMLDQVAAIDNVAYITGRAADEVKTKADELSQYLIGQGVDANTAYYDALAYIADGMDAVSLAQQRMAEAQAVWDQQVATALDSYVAKRTEYEAAVTKTAEAYLSDLGGLFDEFNAGLAGSQTELDAMSQSLLENLRSQVEGIENWASDMERLAARGIDEGLLQELRDMGPEASAQIQALNNMTDEELAEYEGLYKTRSEAARSAAKTALEPMKDDVDEALKAAEKVISDRNETMKQLGEDLAKGIGDGIDAGTWYIEQSARDAINAAVAAARKAGKIESPSKLMRDEVGKYLGEGIGVGFEEAIKKLNNTVSASIRTDGMNMGVNAIGARPSARGSLVINVYPRDLSPGQVDYLIQQANKRLGAMLA
ncbi:MAG: hypothetical protein AAGU74_08275 [Bacillota bacterium]